MLLMASEGSGRSAAVKEAMCWSTLVEERGKYIVFSYSFCVGPLRRRVSVLILVT